MYRVSHRIERYPVSPNPISRTVKRQILTKVSKENPTFHINNKVNYLFTK